MGTYSNLLQPNQPQSIKEESPKTSERNSVRNSARTIFRTEQRSQQRSQKRTEERTVKSTRSELPIKRRTKRYSFEFYDDQLTRLRQLKIEAEMRGERIVLSEMVRQALDAYLKRID